MGRYRFSTFSKTVERIQRLYCPMNSSVDRQYRCDMVTDDGENHKRYLSTQEESDYGTKLQEYRCLAADPRSGPGRLQTQPIISKARTVRSDEPIAQGFVKCTSQYSRGSRTGFQEGIPALPSYQSRIAKRNRLFPALGPRSRVHPARAIRASQPACGKGLRSVARPDQSSQEGSQSDQGHLRAAHERNLSGHLAHNASIGSKMLRKVHGPMVLLSIVL